MPARTVFSWFVHTCCMAMILLCPVLAIGQAEADSTLKAELASAKTDTARARLSGELAWRLKFADGAAALKLAADEIRLAPDDALRLADAYRTKALIMVIGKKMQDGRDLYMLGLENARKAKSTYYEASCFSLMAGMYEDMGDYDQSLHYYLEGLKVSEHGNDHRMTGTLCNNIAAVYSQSGMDPRLSIQFLDRALHEAVTAGNFAFAGLITANMAEEFMRAGKKDSAEMMIRESLQFGVKSGVRGYEYASSLADIGDIFRQLDKPEEAEGCLKESMALMDSLKRPVNVMEPMSALCSLYVKEDEITKAGDLAQRLLHDGLEYHSKPFIRDAYKVLSDIAHKRKQDAIALDYYEQYSAWNDSVFSEAKANSIANVQSRAELAERELEVQYAAKKKAEENKILRLENNNLRNGVIAAITALLLVALLIFFILRDKRNQSRTNRALAEKNKRIEQQSKEKDMLMQEIHHRVKNNLQIVSSLLNLQANAIKDGAAKDALKESLNRVSSIAFIHQKLYQLDDISAILLSEYILQLSNHLKNVFNAKPIEIICNITPPDMKLNMETSVPLGVILNELITNSIKYAGVNRPGGEIKIEITADSNNGQCTLRFSDNGVGMPEDFDITQLPTLGLRMVLELSRQLHGSLIYTKWPEPAFIIQFPLGEAASA